MTVSGSRITVAVTATLLASSNNRQGDQSVKVQNPTGGQIVYIGGSSVTATAYGYALAVGAEASFVLKSGESLYGIVAATTQVVNVLNSGA